LSVAGGPVWRLEHQSGRASDLHGGSASLLEAEPDPVRTVRILHVDRPALVLGSNQPDSDVDVATAAATNVEVVRRRSGGAAVLVDSAAVVWVDLIVPAGDPLWSADVGTATWWVGDVWAAALERMRVGPALVWRGPMRRSAWSGRVCFAGLGPGEVVVGSSKVVGISQRRTRRAALFQTAVLLRWEAGALLAVLRLDDESRARGVIELADVAVGIGPDRSDEVVDSLLAVLSQT